VARKLVVEVVLDSAAYSRQIKQAQAHTSGFTKDLEKVGRGSTAATLGFRGLGRSVAFASSWFIGGAGLGAAVKASFDEMSNAQKVSAQTAAVLKSTGGAAGVTAKQVDELGTSLMNLSGVDDEVIKSAENLLLTFTNISNEAFAPATKAALDMSVALQEDLQTAALQVGKALQDPIKGITTLRRAGVNFTAQQQTLLRTLVQSEQTLDAQKIILHELTREFGGSAEAAGKTLPGQLNILKQNVLNLGGAIAKTLNPALTNLATKTNKYVEQAQKQGTQQNETKRGLEVFGQGLLTAAKHFNIAGIEVKDYVKAQEFLLRQLGRLEPEGGKKVEQFASDLDLLTAAMKRATPASKQYVDLTKAGGIVIPPSVRPIDITGPTAQQRNTWFDNMIGRRELRASLLTSAAAQLAAYKAIGASLTAQIAAVHDVTRKLNLKDQALQVAATVAGLEVQIAADLKQKQQDAAQRLKDQIAAAKQEHEDWLDFAYEKAQTTKTIRDDVKTAQAALAYWKHEAATGKYTVDEARKVLYWNEQLKSLRKQGGTSDPLAGLMQVSSARLASILAAGTGLGARGRAILGANIAGAEIQPLHVHVNIDGREVGRAVTADQARTSRRTASQTSGRRG